jgi:hypothetical protein
VDHRLLHRVLARISAATLVRGGIDLNRKRSCGPVCSSFAAALSLREQHVRAPLSELMIGAHTHLCSVGSAQFN